MNPTPSTSPSPRAPEDAYRVLFDLAPLPMWVRDEQTFRFLTVNHSAIRTYGYTREEFLRMSTFDIRSAEERARMETFFRDHGNNPPHSRSSRWQHLRKDGTSFPVETWSLAVDFNDRPARLVIARDISDQLRNETETHLSRERFRNIASATSDAIWDWDFAANTLWWGDSFYHLFGYAPADFTDQLDAWSEAIHPEERDRVSRSLLEARDQGREFWREEYRFRRKDGTYANVIDRGRIVRNAQGHPERMVGGMTDVTEQLRLHNHYLRAQRLESIGTLAGGIAHDLNNMLSPIMLALELLKARGPDPETARLLTSIESGARRSADLVRKVLTFARGVETRRQPLDLRPLVAEVAHFATETFPRNVKIETDLAPDLWTISADATQINQVILNLALNARDAMPAGGLLLVSAVNLHIDATRAAAAPPAQPGPYVQITVTDTGTGIAHEHLERIFEPFFTTKEVGQGTGLGLATVHAIVRDHGGFITVHSTPYRGTSFQIHLPAVPEISALSASNAPFTPAEPGAPSRPNSTILVIDDESALLELTRHILELSGYTVLTASDGAEGIAVYAQNRERISAVLTDMAMPIMDGHATISALRRISPRVPIIVMSGHDPSGRQLRGLDTEVHHILAKPFGSAQLLTVLRDCLSTT